MQSIRSSVLEIESKNRICYFRKHTNICIDGDRKSTDCEHSATKLFKFETNLKWKLLLYFSSTIILSKAHKNRPIFW